MYNIDLNKVLGKKEVTLQEMLDAREKRVLEQQKTKSLCNKIIEIKPSLETIYKEWKAKK